MGDKYLSQVISYEKDIAPFRFINIFSGVGSGKNYFINQLINGYTEQRPDGSSYEVPPHRVLCITSRRAKVDEIQNDDSVSVGSYVDEWIHCCQVEDLDEYLASELTLQDSNGWGERPVHQRSIVCTNAAIEKYLHDHYNPADVATHLWQRFEIIVLDEAHSTLADASYQTAPFYSRSLINEVVKQNAAEATSCKVIIMTATPRIIEGIFTSKAAHTIDAFEQCINVTPKQVVFINSEDAQKDLVDRFNNGEKAVYFASHIKRLFALRKSIPANQRNRVALSFSAADRLDEKNQEHRAIAEQMERIQKEISNNQRFPENIQLFLTSSRNKEGINLLNGDIKVMYVEAHSEVDIIQMTGRLRRGVDTLYIVTDSPPFPDSESRYEYSFCEETHLVADTNEFFRNICSRNGIDLSNGDSTARKNVAAYPNLNAFIEFIHLKFPYLRFNYFNDQFELYTARKMSKQYYKNQNAIFKAATDSAKALESLAHSWFPLATVSFTDFKRSQIVAYLTENNLIDTPLDKNQLSQVRIQLAAIIGKKITNLNPVLRLYGFCIVRINGHFGNDNYLKRKIVRC